MSLLSSILSYFTKSDGYSAKSVTINFKRIYDLESRYKKLLDSHGINTNLRRCHFWAQIIHESNLKPVEENLNYSAARLLVIFPKYFNVVTAYKYARQPQKIANRVYGGRLGNNPLNDGWTYRGRGFIQTTFRDNYKKLSEATGINYVADPDRLLNEADAMVAALYYWKSRRINAFADMDDAKAVTKLVNGGLNGYDHRLQILNILKVSLQ